MKALHFAILMTLNSLLFCLLQAQARRLGKPATFAAIQNHVNCILRGL